MREAPLHPQKPVLIEHVSDDVRDLKRSSNPLQKTLFSGVAINDLLMGDRFDRNNEIDKFVFTNDDNSNASLSIEERLARNPDATSTIDLNWVIHASIRYVDAATYKNGPSTGFTGTNKIYNAGFVHTMEILPNGSLSYSNDGDCSRANTGTLPRYTRQVFYMCDENLKNTEIYSRTGKYHTEDEKTYVDWSTWEETSGKPMRVRVTEPTADLLSTTNLRPFTIYELFCGQNITLPNPNMFVPGSYIVFEQHMNQEPTYETVTTEGKTPSHNVRYFLKNASTNRYEPAGDNGFISKFENGKTYYVENEVARWVSGVSYDDGTDKYAMELIPALSSSRATDQMLDTLDWHIDNNVAVQYKFEVVNNQAGTGLTWAVDVDNESTERMSDMAELLASHTDMMLTDIVMYDARSFMPSGSIPGTPGFDTSSPLAAVTPKVTDPLVISRPASMGGYIKFTIGLRRNSTAASLTAGFGIKIHRFNETNDFDPDKFTTVFTQVTDTKVPPNQYKQYYTFNPTLRQYVLAGEGGFLTAFVDGTVYYEKNTTPQALSVATDIEGRKCTFFDIGTSTDTENVGFTRGGYFASKTTVTGYIRAYRNDTIAVVITSGNHISDNANVTVSVEFYPDPHDSYILKPQVVTDKILTHAKLDTVTPFPNRRSLIANCESVAEVYEKLAETLQNHGVLWGARPTSNARSTSLDFNSLADISCTWTLNVTSSSSIANGPSNLELESYNNALLIVHHSAAYRFADMNIDGDNATNLSSGSNGVERVTQILMTSRGNVTSSDNKGFASIWIRQRVAGNWTSWIPLMTAPVVITRPSTESSLSADVIAQCLAQGNPHIVLTGSGKKTVTLPDPSLYAHTKFQLELEGCSLSMSFTKDGVTYTYENDAVKTSPSRMLYPIECDGSYWYVVTVS